VKIRHLAYLGLIGCLLQNNGCCRPYYYGLPSRPTAVEGWRKKTENGYASICSLVLNKGESSESQQLGVTLIDIEPGRYCSGPLSEPSATKIMLKFYKPSTGQVLCETTIFAIGASGGGSLDCPDKSELPPSFSIRSHNAKDKWVWLELPQ